MTPRLLLVGVAAAALLPLAGCGGSSIEDYCEQLRADQQQIAEMIDSSSPSALLGELDLLRGLAEKSPDDLADEWQVFIEALDGLDQALDDVGVKPSDFVDGKPPAGLPAADRQEIADAAAEVSSEDVVAAVSGIEQQARDVCKLNLGLA